MNMLIMDPPYRSTVRDARDYGAEWERALARAGAMVDQCAAEAYARRVARETCKTHTSALRDATSLAAMGLAVHVEATAACARIPLSVNAMVNLDPVHTVGGEAVRALAMSATSMELRTPPSEWTTAPPLQLFDP